MTGFARILAAVPLLLAMLCGATIAEAKVVIRSFPVPAGSGAHDVWPAADGTV